jgi:hypothetical protein
MNHVLCVLKIIWAVPWSLFGLAIGGLGLISGGRVRRNGRTLEIWGGYLPTILSVFPFYSGSPVATFGHVVLGRTECYLDACREHQLVHVRQYERWGVLFVPAYLLCAIVLWFQGKRVYYDNPFEQQAFSESRQAEQRRALGESPSVAREYAFASRPSGHSAQGVVDAAAAGNI